MEDVKSILTKRLKIEEGYRKFLYNDTLGNLTGGWGHNFSVKGISPTVGALMLSEDLDEAVAECKENISFFDKLDSVRQSILVDMAFNEGIHSLLGFKNMLTCLEAGDYKGASEDMLDSLANEQVPGRMHPLAKMMESGHES